MRNKAPYNQPFPDLQLVFKDIDLQVIAKRRFQPSEYLNQNLPNTNTTLMPINKPIHLSIEILDPGEEAVNWELIILPSHS